MGDIFVSRICEDSWSVGVKGLFAVIRSAGKMLRVRFRVIFLALEGQEEAVALL